MTAISFALFLLIGLPIAFVLIGSAFIFMAAEGNWRLLNALPQVLFSSLEIFDLLAIPLFILLGEVMNEGGLTQRLISAARTSLRRLPNSLAYVSLIANLMLASIMGSATAQIAVMSRVMVPAMEDDGYKRGFAAALTASAGLIAPLIPPSMIFIIYGVVAQVSVADMFMAGILPGLLMFFLLCLWISIRVPRRDGGSPARPDTAIGNQAGEPARGRVVLDLLVTLSIPGIIVGGIAFGVFTPTESAAIAVVFTLLVGSLYFRKLTFASLRQALVRTAGNTAMVLFLIAAAKVFGWVLTFNMVPQTIALLLQGITSDPIAFLLLTFLFLTIIGFFLDGVAALIVLVPILLPIAVTVYGIDPIQFGVMVCLTLSIGLLTPPVGAGLFIASAAANVKLGALVREILPFLGIAFFVTLCTILAPVLTSAFR